MVKAFITPTEVITALKSQPTTIKWLDTRFDLTKPALGEEQYNTNHITNAVYWSLEHHMSDMTRAPKEGRHPMPTDEQLQLTIERSGLNVDDMVFIYDQGGMPFATRAWFLLKYAGFSNVFIVNGGSFALLDLPADDAALITWDAAVVTPEKTDLTGRLQFQKQMLNDLAQMEDIVETNKSIRELRAGGFDVTTEGKREVTLLDARVGFRFRGEKEPIDPIPGHIPTAKNFDWELLKISTPPTQTTTPSPITTFNLGEVNTEVFTNLLAKVGQDKTQNSIIYCGSGVTAAPIYAVLQHVGYDNISMYINSYSEWLVAHEIAVGDEDQ